MGVGKGREGERGGEMGVWPGLCVCVCVCVGGGRGSNLTFQLVHTCS